MACLLTWSEMVWVGLKVHKEKIGTFLNTIEEKRERHHLKSIMEMVSKSDDELFKKEGFQEAFGMSIFTKAMFLSGSRNRSYLKLDVMKPNVPKTEKKESATEARLKKLEDDNTRSLEMIHELQTSQGNLERRLNESDQSWLMAVTAQSKMSDRIEVLERQLQKVESKKRKREMSTEDTKPKARSPSRRWETATKRTSYLAGVGGQDDGSSQESSDGDSNDSRKEEGDKEKTSVEDDRKMPAMVVVKPEPGSLIVQERDLQGSMERPMQVVDNSSNDSEDDNDEDSTRQNKIPDKDGGMDED